MAGPIVGQVEMFLNNTYGTGSCQFAFVNLYRFLNDNTGSLGIQRIAFNTGSQDAGMTQFRGMNYFDEANPAGQNAWACFRFLSASVPFDVLIQWTGNTAFATAPGDPGRVDAGTATNRIGIAIAQSADMSSSWNGTTKNDGSDVKGSVVWTSSSISSTIYYPRSNDAIRGGSHGSLRQNMVGISLPSTTAVRMHFVADYDSLCIAYDSGADNSYSIFFFGKYTPISGAVVQVPYFCFNDTSIPTSAGTQFGPLAGSTPGGGVSYPQPAISGTVGTSLDRFGSAFFQNSNAQPNRAFAVPRWDEHPVFLGLNESAIVGYLGQHTDIVREVYNIATHDTNGDGTRACVGSTTVASVKFTIPFHSGTVPGSGVTRAGIRYSIP